MQKAMKIPVNIIAENRFDDSFIFFSSMSISSDSSLTGSGLGADSGSDISSNSISLFSLLFSSYVYGM